MAKADEIKKRAEEQILLHERIVDYDTKEYPVETLVEKYTLGKEEEENEIFVPDYQCSATVATSVNRTSSEGWAAKPLTG